MLASMLDRRGFLKFAAGAGIGVLASPVPWKSTDDIAIWSQNWPWIPDPAGGEVSYVQTISKTSPGLGIQVRLLGERPVTIHGNPDHPLSGGSLNALAASEAQMLHSPARVRRPHKRAGNRHVPVAWDEALRLLDAGLRDAPGKGGLYAISGDATSVVNDVLSALSAKSGGACFLMPGAEHSAHIAWKLMTGSEPDASRAETGRLGYDIEHSDMVLAIGANILESWGPVVRNRRVWSAGRPTGGEPSLRLAYASCVQDGTAAVADWWLPVRPGQELALAMGVAHLLADAGRGLSTGDFNAFLLQTGAWTPERVEATAGVPADRLKAVVAAMLQARRPLVIVGSALNQGDGAAPIMAGIACNLMLGNLNAEGGLRILPYPAPVLEGAEPTNRLLDRDLLAWIAALGVPPGGRQAEKAPGACIFYEANPVYALPGAAAALLERSAFTVALTGLWDETARQCDLVLPAAMGLERFDDAETPYGVGSLTYGLGQPVAAPLYEARPAGEVLLAAGRRLGLFADGPDMVGLLKKRAAGLGADWDSLSGGEAHVSRTVAAVPQIFFRPDILSKACAALPTDNGGRLWLAPRVKLGAGTAHTGIAPYAVKLIGPAEVLDNENMLHMNSATAARLELEPGDEVRVRGDGGECAARVFLDESHPPDTVSMLYGLGHTAFDAFSRDKGSNLVQLAAPAAEAGTGLTLWSAITVRVEKV